MQRMNLIFLRESEQGKYGDCKAAAVKPDSSDSDREVVLHKFILAEVG